MGVTWRRCWARDASVWWQVEMWRMCDLQKIVFQKQSRRPKEDKTGALIRTLPGLWVGEGSLQGRELVWTDSWGTARLGIWCLEIEGIVSFGTRAASRLTLGVGGDDHRCLMYVTLSPVENTRPIQISTQQSRSLCFLNGQIRMETRERWFISEDRQRTSSLGCHLGRATKTPLVFVKEIHY